MEPVSGSLPTWVRMAAHEHDRLHKINTVSSVAELRDERSSVSGRARADTPTASSPFPRPTDLLSLISHALWTLRASTGRENNSGRPGSRSSTVSQSGDLLQACPAEPGSCAPAPVAAPITTHGTHRCISRMFPWFLFVRRACVPSTAVVWPALPFNFRPSTLRLLASVLPVNSWPYVALLDRDSSE